MKINESRSIELSDSLKYHLFNDLPLYENVYRYGTDKYFELIREARRLYNSGNMSSVDPIELWILNSNIGEVAIFDGKKVILEAPLEEEFDTEIRIALLELHTKLVKADPGTLKQDKIIEAINRIRKTIGMDSLNEAEYKGREVDLNVPMRSSGPKKYKVYVKNEKGNVIQINFGDVKGGLTTKINDPEARKAFADRHNCKDKKDKTKAGYWSCNLPRYRKHLGMGDNLNTYW